jgi:hypothetical protein
VLDDDVSLLLVSILLVAIFLQSFLKPPDLLLVASCLVLQRPSPLSLFRQAFSL